MSAVRTTSYRLDADVKERLQRQAAVEGISERALLERLVREGLDAVHYPGIVYRDGPTGRRAGLAVGPEPETAEGLFSQRSSSRGTASTRTPPHGPREQLTIETSLCSRGILEVRCERVANLVIERRTKAGCP
jgi:hypothetical protein